MRIVVETDARVASGAECAFPQSGEVWLRVQTGQLYEMREVVTKYRGEPSPPYRSCHRVGAPETNYGCDPTVFLACFDADVLNGRWVRVMNCPQPMGESER